MLLIRCFIARYACARFSQFKRLHALNLLIRDGVDCRTRSSIFSIIIMPSICCVCGANEKEAHLFRFPKEPYREQWREFAEISDVRPWDKLCQRHFTSESLSKPKKNVSTNRLCLRRTAVPLIRTESSITEISARRRRNRPRRNRIKNGIDTLSVTETISCTPDFTPGTESSPANDAHSIRDANLCTPPYTPGTESSPANSDHSITDFTSPATISRILEFHSNLNCPICAAFKQHIPEQCESSPISTVPHGRVERTIRYIGDLSTADFTIFTTPKRARRSINFVKVEVKTYQRRMNILQKRMNRLKSTAKTYTDIISHFKKKQNLLSENAHAAL